MILLGLTGAIGHGKSTFAETLHIHEPGMLHLETNMPIMALAEALQAALITEKVTNTPEFMRQWLMNLPQIIEEHLHREVSEEDVVPPIQAITDRPENYAKLLQYLQSVVEHPEIASNHISAENKDLYRPLLQWIGGYLIDRIHPLIWIGEIIERARDYEAAGGTLAVIGGIRSSSEAEVIQQGGGHMILIKRPGVPEPDLTDPTERERSTIHPNTTVINNGEVTDLLEVAARILNDIRNEQLQSVYEAKPGGATTLQQDTAGTNDVQSQA